MKKFIRALLFLAVLVAGSIFVVTNYSWVFSKRVKGRIVDVQRVTEPTAILGGKATEAQMYSYSILLQADDGKMYTASTEDRQWQVAKAGYCVEALLYRYPPWHLEKAGSFFNARLMEINVCPEGATLPLDPVEPPPSEDDIKK